MIDELKWEPLFVMRLNVGYDRAQRLGVTTAGDRSVFPVDGGTFEGAKLRGTINAGGADWVTIRSDGNMMIDVRITLTTDDGAVIGMTYSGLARAKGRASNEGFQKREL